jgi:t-SNARE complex subunit (syntaxin)
MESEARLEWSRIVVVVVVVVVVIVVVAVHVQEDAMPRVEE